MGVKDPGEKCKRGKEKGDNCIINSVKRLKLASFFLILTLGVWVG